MTNLMSMAKDRFKSTRKKSNTKNMAKKKGKSKGRRSNSSSGRSIGSKIPVVGKVFRNKTVQKVLMGAGAVSLVVSIASLINNPTINKAVNNKLVRVGIAAAGGDIPGAAVQILKETPQLIGRMNGNGGQQQTLLSQAGNGVA